MATNRKPGQQTAVDTAAVKFAIANREGQRRIKLHDQSQQQKATSLKEAVVRTKTSNGSLPDMRFSEDKMKFQPDPSKTLDGNPDGRFLENRPDLLAAHQARGTGRSNFIFTDDMVPDISVEAETAQ